MMHVGYFMGLCTLKSWQLKIWYLSLNFKCSTMMNTIVFPLQMVEHGGFYRTSDQTWVKLERIQFVGACNPPTDPGRKPLTHRYSSQS